MSGNLPILARRVGLRSGTTRFDFAHRGLHAVAEGRVENSLTAFQAAVAGGYGIECDVQAARGGVPVVFHDATLDRLTREAGPLVEREAADVARVALKDAAPAQSIPLLSDLLKLVDGRCPLLVEIKGDWSSPDLAFIDAIGAQATAYAEHVSSAGSDFDPILLMSFDPSIVEALSITAPHVPRGLVSGSYHAADGTPWWLGVLDDARRVQLRDLADFDRVGASFIAYEVGALASPDTSATARVAGLRAGGNPVFAWTVRSATEAATARQHADAAIFEA
ncbi:MAG: glycerophosphodiester phosphodiesterase [Hyphomicrobiaceae bacterium]|nr:glycerophosphodiester phosphodiesterase [Hyphomicrobiaceae bacterium]